MTAELSHEAERHIYRIEPAYVSVWWPEAAPLLKSLIDGSGGRHTVATIHEALERSHMQLWIVIGGDDEVHSAAITEMVSYKGGCKVLRFLLMGGEGDAVEFMPLIEQQAKDQGCHEVEIFGRRGWERVFKDYKFQGVSLGKRLI